MQTNTQDELDLRTRLMACLERQAPKLNRWAICGAVESFLAWRSTAGLGVPGKGELVKYLRHLNRDTDDKRAATEFSYLQIGASWVWGTEETAHFAVVLRESRVSAKPKAMDEWDRAMVLINRLPEAWRIAMTRHLDASRPGRNAPAGTRCWSASHIASVASALIGWHAHCAEHGLETRPGGASLDAYARSLLERGVSVSSAAHYLSRIHSGFSTVLAPGRVSTACDWVVRDWKERGARHGTPTKTAAQLVSATAIYALGFDLMDRGRRRRTRGMRAALDFRNGILLATAIALPQRARALSVLEVGKTLFLPEPEHLHVRVPGRFLKKPEAWKAAETYDQIIRNPGLYEAMGEYLRDFRPHFDDGHALFPSMHAPSATVTESQLGRLAGSITEKHFGVRISIHRFRDNVATEMGESVKNGGRLAPAVLGHTDAATTARHYERSEGHRAARDYAEMLEERRSKPEELAL